MRASEVEKRLKYLTYYSVFITFLLLVLIVGAFTYSGSNQFEEIDVKRINIIEPNGQNALVLANSQQLPGAVINGDTLTNRKGIPGIIFYNSEGDETGGLIFASEKTDSSDIAFGHLSFDRYNQNQVLSLDYTETASEYKAGLSITDRPEISINRIWEMMNAAKQGDNVAKQKIENLKSRGRYSARRLFVGTKGRTALLRLNDRYGNERIRISVDSTDSPQLQFLDKDGDVTFELPQK